MLNDVVRPKGEDRYDEAGEEANANGMPDHASSLKTPVERREKEVMFHGWNAFPFRA